MATKKFAKLVEVRNGNHVNIDAFLQRLQLSLLYELKKIKKIDAEDTQPK